MVIVGHYIVKASNDAACSHDRLHLFKVIVGHSWSLQLVGVVWVNKRGRFSERLTGDIEMKTDKELLILAAKAAGFEAQYSENFGDFSIGEPYSKNERRWNPLSFDGDALRLAVDLDMDVCLNKSREAVTAWGCYGEVGLISKNENYGNDKHAATRRAIVRAAAAIGEQME